MRSYRISKSTSTVTATTPSVSVSGGSQPESSAGQRQQGSYVGIPTTAHASESTYTPAAERYTELRLLAEVSTSQIDPFAALATHVSITFDDEDQEQSASSLLLSNEPSQATDDVDPIMVVAEPHETGTSENPKRPSSQNLADQNADSTDKWITFSGDEARPFQCGYEGCGKTYITKHYLQRHFVSHIGDSQFRCYFEDCAGMTRYWDRQALARHIRKKHTLDRPYECDNCDKRFLYFHNLTRHRRSLHSVKDEQNQPQNSGATDRWIIYSDDITKPFKCGYEGCGKQYTRKSSLRNHFISHIGGSQFRCYYGDCAGAMRYCDSQALARHIHLKHTMLRPYKCDTCNKQYGRPEYLKYHKEQVHSTEKEQLTKKEQKPPTKRKRK